MTTFKSSAELINSELNYEDEIIFSVNGKTFNYRVRMNHCNGIKETFNKDIFTELGILETKYEIASNCYGYLTEDGLWPVCTSNDYQALKNLILHLFALCEATKVKSKLGYNFTDRFVALKGEDGLYLGMATGKNEAIKLYSPKIATKEDIIIFKLVPVAKISCSSEIKYLNNNN